MTRRNDRRLRTDQGEMVRHRARWTVTAIDPQGSLTVRGRDGIVRLPAEFAGRHVQLGYAETIVWSFHHGKPGTLEEARAPLS